ncbi:MAG: GAF and ANTAR domain-containing protein [Actinomycetota bacterium]|nr:GAF and ANTAR domain-containing protein [Actinomycetota bacterium]
MAKNRPDGEIKQTVSSLSDLNLSEETLDSVLGHVGRLGVSALQGWDASGTTLVHGDKVATFGVTDERIQGVDQQQYDTRRGPCVDALDGDIRYFNGQDIDPRWRQFAEAAAGAGVHSVLSLPLKIRDEVIGAMNFYSSQIDALRPGQREEGTLFASQAAVALANARELGDGRRQIEQLQEGLGTRTMIGQATGLLMAQEGLSSNEAFAKLVYVSQTSNIKLRDIAQRYVETWENRVKT